MAIVETNTDTVAKMFANQLESHILSKVTEEISAAVEAAKDKVLHSLNPTIEAYVAGITTQIDMYRVLSMDKIEIHIRIDGVKNESA